MHLSQMANLTPFRAPIPAILHFELMGFNHENKKNSTNIFKTSNRVQTF